MNFHLEILLLTGTQTSTTPPTSFGFMCLFVPTVCDPCTSHKKKIKLNIESVWRDKETVTFFHVDALNQHKCHIYMLFSSCLLRISLSALQRNDLQLNHKRHLELSPDISYKPGPLIFSSAVNSKPLFFSYFHLLPGVQCHLLTTHPSHSHTFCFTLSVEMKVVFGLLIFAATELNRLVTASKTITTPT